jgi:hypothetical protein
MNRRTAITAVVFVALFATIFAIYLVEWEGAINVENAERVELGMTRAQVYQIIGSPHEKQPGNGTWREVWFSARINIRIDFDENGVVFDRFTWFEPSARPSTIELLLRKIGIR